MAGRVRTEDVASTQAGEVPTAPDGSADPTARRPAARPERLLGGRYRIVAPLGAGGMSVVWRARDEVLGRTVAVKVLAAPFASDRAFRDRIRTEAQSAAQLTHPHVTNVYDFGEEHTPGRSPQPFVVMELVEGVSLAVELDRGPLSWRTALEVGAQTASALAAAHACGLVHRDITPSNIMITETGVKVVDFGIAAIVGQRPGGPVIGTPEYLAPERMTEGEVGPAADVYALGVVVYQALAGDLPWPSPGGATVADAATAGAREPRELPEIPGLPDGVADVIASCLAADPDARPTAAALSRALTRAGAAPAAFVGRAATTQASSPRTGTRILISAFPPDQLPRPDDPYRPDQPANPYGSDLSAATVQGDPRLAHGLSRAVPLTWALTWAAAAVVLVAVLAAGAVALARVGRSTSAGVGGSGAGAGASTGGAANPAPSHAADPAATSGPCAVRYTVRSEWADGATVDLEITNTGPAQITGWTLQFELVPGLTVGGAWNGTWRQDGDTVTVEAANYNRVLEPGRPLTAGPGANLSGKGSKQTRPRFRLNGRVCDG